MNTNQKNELFATLSLICGILTIVFPLPFVGISLLTSSTETLMASIQMDFVLGYVAASPLAVVSVVFGCLVKNKVIGKFKTMAKVGFILGIIVLAFTILAIIVLGVMLILSIVGLVQFYT